MEEDDTETLERKLREKALQSMQRHNKSPEAPPEQDDDWLKTTLTTELLRRRWVQNQNSVERKSAPYLSVFTPTQGQHALYSVVILIVSLQSYLASFS